MIGARTSSILVDALVLIVTWTQLWNWIRSGAAQSAVSRPSLIMVFLRDGA